MIIRLTFMDFMHTENQVQVNFCSSAPQEVSGIPELILGDLLYILTGVPSQWNSPILGSTLLSALQLCTMDHHTLGPVIQTVFNPYHCLLIQPLLLHEHPIADSAETSRQYSLLISA